MGPPNDSPLEQAAAKVAKKAMSANLPDDIRRGGSARQNAKASLAKTVNAAVNVIIGNGFLSAKEGKDLKNALFSSAIKAVNKPNVPSKDDVMVAIRNGVAHLKPAKDRELAAKDPEPVNVLDEIRKGKTLKSTKTQNAPPHPPPGLTPLQATMQYALSTRRQAVQPDDPWD